MLRPAFALATALFIFAACGGDDSSSTDSGPPPSDAGKEAACQYACGCTLPALTCHPGKANAVCDTRSSPLVCPDGGTTWSCPTGTVPADQCGCNTASYPNLNPGDPCPGQSNDGGGD